MYNRTLYASNPDVFYQRITNLEKILLFFDGKIEFEKGKRTKIKKFNFMIQQACTQIRKVVLVRYKAGSGAELVSIRICNCSKIKR